MSRNHQLRVWAKHADKVSVINSFNNWSKTPTLWQLRAMGAGPVTLEKQRPVMSIDTERGSDTERGRVEGRLKFP